MAKKFLCPFCISEYDIKLVKYICPDDGYEAFPGFFERRSNKAVKCSNPNHPNGLATRRVCPQCGETIPLSALQNPSLPICIVGGTSSGKTNFITVMLEELNKVGNLGISLGFQNNETMMHQRMHRDMIYRDKLPPEATPFGEIPRPQIWEIRKNNAAGKEVPAYNFTIFDGAGENTNEIRDTEIGRYISNSKAILLVLDPLTLEKVITGGTVDEKVMQDSNPTSDVTPANQVLNTLATTIRNMDYMSTGARLTMPVAVVLTKFDTIRNSYAAFNSSAIIHQPKLTTTNGKISMEEIDRVHNEIVEWLNQIGEESFLGDLNSHFTNFKLFGVSSYGSPPDGFILPEIKPHRVLDPMLWLFKTMNYIE